MGRIILVRVVQECRGKVLEKVAAGDLRVKSKTQKGLPAGHILWEAGRGEGLEQGNLRKVIYSILKYEDRVYILMMKTTEPMHRDSAGREEKRQGPGPVGLG